MSECKGGPPRVCNVYPPDGRASANGCAEDFLAHVEDHDGCPLGSLHPSRRAGTALHVGHVVRLASPLVAIFVEDKVRPDPAHRHNLLFVEDDHDTREFLMALARSVGLEAFACASGRSALDMLRRGFRPCLIVLDMAMPDMDRFAFRREQMADPELHDIAVAIVSGSGWDTELDARKLDLAVFLHKPVDPELLLDAFEAHCGARRSN